MLEKFMEKARKAALPLRIFGALAFGTMAAVAVPYATAQNMVASSQNQNSQKVPKELWNSYYRIGLPLIQTINSGQGTLYIYGNKDKRIYLSGKLVDYYLRDYMLEKGNTVVLFERPLVNHTFDSAADRYINGNDHNLTLDEMTIGNKNGDVSFLIDEKTGKLYDKIEIKYANGSVQDYGVNNSANQKIVNQVYSAYEKYLGLIQSMQGKGLSSILGN